MVWAIHMTRSVARPGRGGARGPASSPLAVFEDGCAIGRPMRERCGATAVDKKSLVSEYGGAVIPRRSSLFRTPMKPIILRNGEQSATFVPHRGGYRPEWFRDGSRVMLRFKDHTWLNI